MKEDELSKTYRAVRDATVLKAGISNAEAIAVLEIVKNELVSLLNAQIHFDNDVTDKYMKNQATLNNTKP